MTRGRPLTVTLVAFVVLGVLVDVLIGATAPFPGYAAALGLVGCILIIVVSKWLGKAFIQAPEDHYPDDTPTDLVPDLHGPTDTGGGDG